MGVFVLEASARVSSTRRTVPAAATAAAFGRVCPRGKRSDKIGLLLCQFERTLLFVIICIRGFKLELVFLAVNAKEQQGENQGKYTAFPYWKRNFIKIVLFDIVDEPHYFAIIILALIKWLHALGVTVNPVANK